MAKPNYRVVLSFDAERKVFHARAPELEHCSAEGETRADAISKLEQEIDAQLQNMTERGHRAPQAVDEVQWSGEVTAKVSRTLHRDLAWQARSDWEIFKGIARSFSACAPGHLGVEKDLVLTPIQHDSPNEIAVPLTATGAGQAVRGRRYIADFTYGF